MSWSHNPLSLSLIFSYSFTPLSSLFIFSLPLVFIFHTHTLSLFSLSLSLLSFFLGRFELNLSTMALHFLLLLFAVSLVAADDG